MKNAIVAAMFIILTYTPVFAQTSQDLAGDISFRRLISIGQDQKEAITAHEKIYQATGFANTFMVITDEGNVIIDTSIKPNAERHRKLLRAVDKGPIKYIIITHAHSDHIGGLEAWKETDTEVIQQKEAVEFMHWQSRIRGKGNYAATIPATILFDDKYAFELGGIRFEIYHTPGETYDHLSVWIPRYKAAFIGDNYYESFPNIYTLRGTKPRWALDYVNSINKILKLKPEILLPSHGIPVHGNVEITRRLVKYREAILYIHDETVKGLARGVDRFTLMKKIKLPPELELGEGYGRVDWSVRGIYEGYQGFFDEKVATMYPIPPDTVYPEVVKLAGGPGSVAERAMALVKEGKFVEGLHLADMALSADPEHQDALKAKLASLEKLMKTADNPFKNAYIGRTIKETKAKLHK